MQRAGPGTGRRGDPGVVDHNLRRRGSARPTGAVEHRHQRENVGYVYLFAGFLDQQANSIYVADMDYLESGDTRQIDGYTTPTGRGAFTMEFEWEPLMFAISDGSTSVTRRSCRRALGLWPRSRVHGGRHLHLRRRRRIALRPLYFINGN